MEWDDVMNIGAHLQFIYVARKIKKKYEKNLKNCNQKEEKIILLLNERGKNVLKERMN